MSANNDIDRASWTRLGSDKEGCNVAGCTRHPAIIVKLRADEISDTGQGVKAKLAERNYRFCAAHAEQKFIRATEAVTK